MALHLSSTDQALLAEATRQLLSPLDYERADDWRRAAVGGVKALLGADIGSCIVPVPGEQPVFTDADKASIREYAVHLAEMERKYGFVTRRARLGVYHRRLMIEPFRESFYRDPYYHEFLVPRRMFDSAGICINLWRPGGSVACELILNQDPRGKGRYGARALGVLRLLMPAFGAGAQTIYRLHGARRSFSRVLDGLGEAVLLFNHTGRLLHRTPRAAALLDGTRGVRLTEAIARVVENVRGAVDGLSTAGASATSCGRYSIRATFAGEQLLGSRPGIVVTIDARHRQLAFDEELVRETFHLTRQETRVAALLAERKTNAEIADALCISPHTARHHTERVLCKLGISSRKEVAAALERAKRPPVTNS